MQNEALRSMLAALLVAFGVMAACGPLIIRALRRLGLGQNVYELAPAEHQKKQGTPTMAGLAFALVSIVLAFALRRGGFDVKTDFVLAISLFALLNLAIGFADDFLKVRGHNNKGLGERQKLLPQGLVALLFTLYCYFHPQIGSQIRVPFSAYEWNLGLFYIPLMTFVIICTTNGANLLDGLDGLLGSVSTVIMGFFVLLIAVLMGNVDENLRNVGVLCAALAGALMGYLCYNLHPARMIMGDTGSMFLGGVVVGVAMVTRQPLLIPIVAAGYAASLLSVFMQRWYFRLTGGKRIFKMSPLHHHFELLGVPETKIVSMYTLVTVLMCAIGLLAIY